MACESESNSIEDVDEEEQCQQEHEAAVDAPAHHPSAPPDELFDISTTVDPSYIISLIRKLIPRGTGNDCKAHEVDPTDVHGTGSNADYMEECGVSSSRDGIPKSSVNGSEKLNMVNDFDKSTCQNEDDKDSTPRCEKPGVQAEEEVWEECGCLLWDLAANRTHAELMEICLGIIGNLACHKVPMKHIVSTNGLIELIIDQLFSDDTQCLCEACRLITLGLQGDHCNTWGEALQSKHVLGRIVWVAENTLNPQLLEKSVGLLLAILQNQQEVSSPLLPSLMSLGLANLLVNLLAFEMNTLSGERVPERYSILDVILCAIEALSTIDGFSQDICSNKELFQLVCDLVKLPDKVEVSNSCATAAVLIANILSDVPNLASEMSNDLTFLQGLLDIFPLASDDMEAQSALWSVIAKLLVQVKENEMDISILHQYVLVLASNADLIEDILLGQKLDNHSEDSKSSIKSDIKSNSISTTVSSFWDSSENSA